MQHTKTRGFSLLELMIVVAIVGIIAAVAVPSYQSSILKGKRAEGRAAVMDILQQQERYIIQNGVYGQFDYGATTDVGASFKTFSGDNATKAAYLLRSELCDSPNDDPKICIRVLAKPQPISGDPDPEVRILQATSTGIKTCSGTTTSLCW